MSYDWLGTPYVYSTGGVSQRFGLAYHQAEFWRLGAFEASESAHYWSLIDGVKRQLSTTN